MKLQERMFNMSKAECAFRAKSNGWVYTVVPSGPYSGTWMYKNHQLAYRTDIFQSTRVFMKDKCVSLPLPAWFYDKPEKYFAEQIGDLQQGLYRKLWSNFRFAHLDVLEREVDQYVKEMGLNKSTAAICLALTPDVFRKVVYAFPDRVKHVTDWLTFSRILETIGVAKRKSFVERALQHGLKVALRKSFRKITSQTIGSIVNDRSVVDCRILSSIILPVKYRVIVELKDLRKTHDLPLAAENVLLKYGSHALAAYRHYYYERSRASASYGIDVSAYPLDAIHNANIYMRWHDQIADKISERVAARLITGRAEDEAAHRANWDNLDCPASVTPLITYEEFQDEGKSMHHCVGSYFESTRMLFAHIEYMGEKATVQFDQEQVIQLFGACNEEVSPELRAHFMQFYDGTK